MTFPSIIYALFLLSVIGIYWALRQPTLRLWMLVLASLVFYASLQIEYVPLLLIATLINFRLGGLLNAPVDWRSPQEEQRFANQDWHRRRLYWLWLGIGLNIMLLVVCKYLPFLISILGTLLNLSLASQSTHWLETHLLAPLGISFFCFESVAYLVDVYRGAPPTQRWLEFAAYKLFFPKLISGPITRFHHWVGQFQNSILPRPEQTADGLWLIATGAVKKLLLADRLGILVDLSFENLARAGSGDLWLATFAYGLQIYLDFSGYVDIARGSAILLGLNLPQNFDFPYFCTNIADFWRRWHMTLGDWLRNYLYFPLGGSRQGLKRTCLNLMVVMLVAGIWHGADWGFIVWGGLHGLALVIHRLTVVWSKRWSWLETSWQRWPGMLLAWGMTQGMVFTTWIFFRLPDLKDSGLVLQRLWGHTADVQFYQKVYLDVFGLERLQITLLLWLIVAVMAVLYGFNRGLKLQLNWPTKILLTPVFFFVAWLLAPSESSQYIYFDF
ncbi:MAG: MBOAT family protein [Cyanothece sp. SIO1E1]|nr:MBOAT family protein [Cyanothece sp. SIO1E1]